MEEQLLSKKLFNIAKSNHIALFMLLWASFNNWYREYFKERAISDKEIINRLKKGEGPLKTCFDRLLSSNQGSTFGETDKFKYNLINFVSAVKLVQKDGTKKNLLYTEVALLEKEVALLEKEKALLEIPVIGGKTYFITGTSKDKFFEETLENIYNIRCYVIHGDFDVDAEEFIYLLERSCVILYLLMDRVLKNN